MGLDSGKNTPPAPGAYSWDSEIDGPQPLATSLSEIAFGTLLESLHFELVVVR
jgi:hypothetical protein